MVLSVESVIRLVALLLFVITVFIFSRPAKCQVVLTAIKKDIAIEVDGQVQEWERSKAEKILVFDQIAGVQIEVKALYDTDNIYMSVRFPDHREDRLHKSWVWDQKGEVYRTGWNREDVFVVKWFMDMDSSIPYGTSIQEPLPHKADIWFWKANRTDPVGYADDKIHYFQNVKAKRATEVKVGRGQSFYLLRRGDAGEAAYQSRLVVDYSGDRLRRFENKLPKGSRADVQAKGVWKDGQWTIEFKRALNTGHEDDLTLTIDGEYIVGVSCYEIAGRQPDPRSEQPLYAAGDITQPFVLRFKQ